MHFLTNKEDKEIYKNKIYEALKPKCYLIIMAFEIKGLDKCSGLPARRYSLSTLIQEFQSFNLLYGKNHSHFTPDGVEQKFISCLFQLK